MKQFILTALVLNPENTNAAKIIQKIEDLMKKK